MSVQLLSKHPRRLWGLTLLPETPTMWMTWGRVNGRNVAIACVPWAPGPGFPAGDEGWGIPQKQLC